jgi:hypothetical protein
MRLQTKGTPDAHNRRLDMPVFQCVLLADIDSSGCVITASTCASAIAGRASLGSPSVRSWAADQRPTKRTATPHHSAGHPSENCRCEPLPADQAYV